jgi:hypothetical protein
MVTKKSLLVSIGLIVLASLIAVASFSGGPEDRSDATSLSSSEQFDLADALDNAVSGDVIVLTENTALSRSASVKKGVILNDDGFSLTILENVTLGIEGELITSGNLTVQFRGSIAVADGGLISMDNEGKAAEIHGLLEIYKGGAIKIGFNKSSVLRCSSSTSILRVEGSMSVGNGTLNSDVEVRNGTIAGELSISGGSNFRVFDVLTIGHAPTLINDTNRASLTGKVTITDSAYILVYGNPGFTSANIMFPSVSTQFQVLGNVYATEYKDINKKRTITFPSTSSLRDYSLAAWKDSGGNEITGASGIQIGSNDYKVIYGEVVKKTYKIVLTEDSSIRWVVNGKDRGSSGVEEGVYGASYTISVRLAKSTLPEIFKDGTPYVADTLFTVTGDTTFTTSNNYPSPKGDIVVPLLIVLGVLLFIFVLLVIVIRSRNAKKAG